MKRAWIAAAAAALAAGCGTANGAFPTYKAGDHTVAVAPYEYLAMLQDNAKAYVDLASVVATAKVVAVNEMAYEVQPDPNAEGASEGEGPEIYGTVTFELVNVIKGKAQANNRLTIAYLSGKWNKTDKEMRLAYTYENLKFLQTDRGTLKPPSDHSGTTFLIFAAEPKGEDVLGHRGNAQLLGLATTNAAGVVQFSGTPPFLLPNGTTVVKLDDFIQAAK